LKTKGTTGKIEGIEPVKATQKKYGSRAIWIAIIVGLCFFLAGQKPVGKGVILGSIFSVANFILIGKALPLRIGKSKRKTFFLSLGSIFFRYVLMAIPIIVAVKFKQFNLVAAIVGLFMIQFVILADHLGKLISSIRNK
jgi:asparagine N-glycosylation enzyme membrane subunit Stt3